MRGAGVAIEPQKIFEPPLRIILDVDANPRVPDGQGGGGPKSSRAIGEYTIWLFFPHYSPSAASTQPFSPAK